MKPLYTIAVSCVMLVILFPVNLFACACCAEKGAYFLTKDAIAEYELELLNEMKFGANSHLFLDAGEFESIRGLDDLKKAYESDTEGLDFDKIGVSNVFGSKAWKFSFDAGNRLRGSLELQLPAEMESFKVDIHDGKSGGAGGPLLYKEMRFVGGKTGSASGFFRGIPPGTRYSLIFQGRGNMCDNAQDFTHWRLDFNDAQADFSFYGKMASGNSEYYADDKDIDSGAPRFEDYAAKVWNARPKPIKFSSHKNARMFRTRLKEAWRNGVNFAGHFIFTSWGCGTGCQVGAIIDAKTGSVYFPDEMAGMGFGIGGTSVADEPMEYRKDSSLFILRGTAANSSKDSTSYLVWKGKRFEQTAVVASGRN